MFWQRLMRPGLGAVAETLFPVNDLGAPDWRDTAMVERSLAFFASLPPFERRLMTLLYIVVQIATLLTFTSVLPFSWLPRQRRTAIIRRWRASRIYPLKILGDALKATMTMVYLSHPSALRFMGVYTVCENPGEDFDIDVRPGMKAPT